MIPPHLPEGIPPMRPAVLGRRIEQEHLVVLRCAPASREAEELPLDVVSASLWFCPKTSGLKLRSQDGSGAVD
jgi:hypothetical protein